VQLLPQEQPGVRLWPRRPADNAGMRAQRKEGVGTRGTIARTGVDGSAATERASPPRTASFDATDRSVAALFGEVVQEVVRGVEEFFIKHTTVAQKILRWQGGPSSDNTPGSLDLR